ncbi:hypothetical protein [Sphingomonas glacialis]|uniref:hypothetical protein n=1 Tax=Sphingomonas glacialis TaxID=658225 RepID=UPI00167894FC|nr:hypothetical protein [Sphingomonas glacialis]
MDGGFRLVAVFVFQMHSELVTNRNRTPQEKKTLSLKKDRRQSYFASGQKGARKAIPLRKRLENRRNRHKNDQAIAIAVEGDELALDLAESSARNDVHRAGGWKKGADRPLGEAIALQQAKRGYRIGRKERSRTDHY